MIVTLSQSMKLLFIASDAREFGGLLKHCARVHKLDLPVDWARAATLGDYEIAMAANGVGARQAAAAADALISVFAADAIISIGFCGALSPKLGHFDIVVGETVISADLRYEAQPLKQSPPSQTGIVITTGRVAGTAEEKAGLYATGAIAVDMEAAGVAGRAQAWGLPFFCIKTVTDRAGESLANDFNAALRSDGHFDTMKILQSSLRHPWVRVPELFRLQRRSPLAARSLGDFIANCRF
jgi:adenosylhomocysteine nucleosidase